jgi:hypothetical protein
MGSHLYRGWLLVVLLLSAWQFASAADPDAHLLRTRWGQTGTYAMYTPRHERLGCWSTALGQILYFHRLLPKGDMTYRCSDGTVVICQTDRYPFDFANFTNQMDEKSTDLQKQNVAAYLFVTASVIQKDYGTGDYLLTHEVRAAALARHYACTAQYLRSAYVSLDDLEKTIAKEIAARRPVMLHMRNLKRDTYHAVVIDGCRQQGEAAEVYVHINMGFEGRQDGWYAFRKPIDVYDDTGYRNIMLVRPQGKR